MSRSPPGSATPNNSSPRCSTCHPTEAGTRVAHATQLAPRRALTGASLPALLPNTAVAVAAGQIGPAQVRVITETMNAIPGAVNVEHGEVELTGQ